MIPVPIRVLRQDLPGAPDWTDPMLSKLNTGFQQSYQLFNGGLTFQNFVGSLVRVSFTTPSTYGGSNTNFTQFTFPITFQGASSVLIGSCDVDSGNLVISNQPLTIPVGGWREVSPGKITIFYMTGLTASTSYIAYFQCF